MALNKKLIVLSGVGLVFAGVGAGVIGYKASQVADGQKQMDDSKASMGGQLSFGLANPLGNFAATAAGDFKTNIQTKIAADIQRKMAAASDPKVMGASYVNLSDQIQGDLITGVAHTLPGTVTTTGLVPGKPATDVGDSQSSLKQMLIGSVAEQLLKMNPKLGTMAAAQTQAATVLTVKDYEVANLRASDIRKLINNDLPKSRLDALGLNATTAKEIISSITNASVISLNVGIEDIIEAATKGETFQQIATPDKTMGFPGLASLIGALTSAKPGDNTLMEAAINAVGNLNGALSSIRRINPEAKIALGMLGTYGVPQIDALLGQINQAIQVAAMTQNVKDGIVTVAPINPMDDKLVPTGTGSTTSLQAMYSGDATHMYVSAQFGLMMLKQSLGDQFGPKWTAIGGPDLKDPTKATPSAILTTIDNIKKAAAQAAAAVKPSTGAKVNP